jgi:amino acid transporter
VHLDSASVAALVTASLSTVYSYLGYYNVCHLGGDIVNPQRNIPRSMFISIAGITILYLLMNISVASVLSYKEITESNFVVSRFVEVLAGSAAAHIITVLILWVAFASIFSATLGYSRIPYAAAKDGAFFGIFAKLHPTRNFPHVSLLFVGGVALVFSLIFNSVGDVIKSILAMRILVQFIGQAIGLILLHKRKGKMFFPWRMPLYPLPVILAIVIWGALFYYTGKMMLYGVLVIIAGVIAYLIKAGIRKEWPFIVK